MTWQLLQLRLPWLCSLGSPLQTQLAAPDSESVHVGKIIAKPFSFSRKFRQMDRIWQGTTRIARHQRRLPLRIVTREFVEGETDGSPSQRIDRQRKTHCAPMTKRNHDCDVSAVEAGGCVDDDAIGSSRHVVLPIDCVGLQLICYGADRASVLDDDHTTCSIEFTGQ